MPSAARRAETVTGSRLELLRGDRGGIEAGIRAPAAGRTLEVGHEPALRALHHLHQLPALLPPVVEDGGGVVNQGGCGEVLPRGHLRLLPGSRCVTGKALMTRGSDASARRSVKGSAR